VTSILSFSLLRASPAEPHLQKRLTTSGLALKREQQLTCCRKAIVAEGLLLDVDVWVSRTAQ